ncbi:MAG: response regulator [Deltaproteobacteria bacterium]|nr:response regulator [Deltaproteobacteria bacterium]
MRILIADDDFTSRTMLDMVLQSQNYEVTACRDGIEAWDIIKKGNAPNIMILDWLMPDMDGIELLIKIRSLKTEINPYIIMLTGKTETEAIISALEKGADDMLSKPYQPAELIARVNAGIRMVEAQQKLIEQSRALKAAQMQIANDKKLKAVGQLAAGLSHEINTPVQFISDSIHFLQDVYIEYSQLTSLYQEATAELKQLKLCSELLNKIEDAESKIDFAFINENIPDSFKASYEGLNRISSIVTSMKEFATPTNLTLAPHDLNKSLRDAVNISRKNIEAYTDIVFNPGDLPMVKCSIDDLNQVFLNIIKNSAQSIKYFNEKENKSEKGCITITSYIEGKNAIISVADTGHGIPEKIKDRVFEPFFTTREVGSGQGQGLAISRTIIVDKHKGKLTFESEEGKGATFFISIPING